MVQSNGDMEQYELVPLLAASGHVSAQRAQHTHDSQRQTLSLRNVL